MRGTILIPLALALTTASAESGMTLTELLGKTMSTYVGAARQIDTIKREFCPHSFQDFPITGDGALIDAVAPFNIETREEFKGIIREIANDGSHQPWSTPFVAKVMGVLEAKYGSRAAACVAADEFMQKEVLQLRAHYLDVAETWLGQNPSRRKP